MGRGSKPTLTTPDLGPALRWLRHEARLTRKEACERAERIGEGFSEVYLRQCESGTRWPSKTVLQGMLKALDADRETLDALLSEQPWVSRPLSSTYRATSKTPKVGESTLPPDFIPESLSGSSSLRARRQHLGQPAQPEWALSSSFGGRGEASVSSCSDGGFQSALPDLETQELVSGYARLKRADQLTVLGVLRGLLRD